MVIKGDTRSLDYSSHDFLGVVAKIRFDYVEIRLKDGFISISKQKLGP